MSPGRQPRTDNEYGARADDGVKVTTPFGTVQAHGPMVIAVVLVVCAVGVLGFMQRDHDLRNQEMLNRVTEARTAQMTAMAAQQTRVEETLNNLVYVTLLPDSKKAAIKLDMPIPLRNQLLNQERGR